jgi:predicted O-methyltransferase YrrM
MVRGWQLHRQRFTGELIIAEYTKDWFSTSIANFETIKKTFIDDQIKITEILEIGSYEGRSASWMLQNMLDDHGTITCVDTFAKNLQRISPFKNSSYVIDEEIINRFRCNTDESKKSGQVVNVIIQSSYNALAELIVRKKLFDFIYVDGNHCADTTLTDACMCFGLLKPGGIMLFDDYLWDKTLDILKRPRVGIDAFVNIFSHDLELLGSDYQLWIKKC